MMDGLPDFLWIQVERFEDTPQNRKKLITVYEELQNILESKDYDVLLDRMKIPNQEISHIEGTEWKTYFEQIFQFRAEFKYRNFKIDRIPCNEYEYGGDARVSQVYFSLINGKLVVTM